MAAGLSGGWRRRVPAGQRCRFWQHQNRPEWRRYIPALTATRWAESGIDIATIAAWLGHANLRSVQKYVHPSREHLNAQAEKFEQIWAAREKQPEEKTRLQ